MASYDKAEGTETIYGAEARRLYAALEPTGEEWDNDGQNGEGTRWYAVQPFADADGREYIVRFGFDTGYEPETDEDYAAHVVAVWARASEEVE